MANNQLSADQEIWVPVDGFEDYIISNKGSIKSTRNSNEIIVSPYYSYGYHRVKLVNDTGNKNFRVHRLVALAFIPNPDGKPLINHKDGNKLNNNASNLEWATNSENVRHSIALMKENGIYSKGQRGKWMPVLCPEDSLIFRSIAAASRHYKVSKRLIKLYIKTGHRIKSGKSFQWHHVALTNQPK